MATKQCVFPAELICQVLCHTTVRDVVRWQVVSKWFCAITRDPAVWDALYEHAPFPRPPGPFRNAAFKSAFLQSARLAQSWTTKSLRKISRFEVPISGNMYTADPPRLIGGRWFVVYETEGQFLLYDIHARVDPPTPQVLWEGEGDIDKWDEYSTVLEDGNYVVYVLTAIGIDDSLPRWTLLEFRLDADSGALIGTHSLHVPSSYFGDMPVLHGGLVSSSGYLVIPGQSLVLNMRTRIFYTFPEFNLALEATKSFAHHMDEDGNIVLTNTHVIVLRDYYPAAPWRQCGVVVQAFTLPNDQHPGVEDGNNVLHLSHEGIYESRNMLVGVIRNSIVDPSTGDVNVRLLERSTEASSFHAVCVDLTLHGPSSLEVSGMTIGQHTPLVIGNVPPDFDGESIQYDYVSDNGYARGLYAQYYHNFPGGGTITGFTIDATQLCCRAVFSEHMAGDWMMLVCRRDKKERRALAWSTLDGVRGRIAYFKEHRTGNSLVVVDIE